MSVKRYRNLTLWLVLALLLVVLAAIGACGPSPTPEPTKIIQGTLEPPMQVKEPKPIPGVTVPPWTGIPLQGNVVHPTDGAAYVEGQVIVMGPADEVESLVKDALSEQAFLDHVYLLNLTRLIPDDLQRAMADQWSSQWASKSMADNPVVIGLFPTQGEDAIKAVNDIEEAAIADGVPVFPELNRITGQPHIVAGSPHIVAGSPEIIQGVGGHGAFWSQWALGPPPGIGLIVTETEDSAMRTVDDQGNGTRIVLFDSSPFDESGGWQIDWISPTLSLTVYHLVDPPAEITDASDHGLFVAGLAHAVVPESDIHLVQVLNGDLTSTLGMLNLALFSYMDYYVGEKQETLDRTVMNFSLGFPYDPELDPPNGKSYNPWKHYFGKPGNSPGKRPLPSFATLIGLADYHGAALVGASGNTTDVEDTDIELPAAYDIVLDVQASGFTGTPTCYTRVGMVAAPGGDPVKKSDGSCSKELDANGCPRGIVSLAFRTAHKTGYACWTGTSFAAPLVSGEAAIKVTKCGGSMLASDLQSVVSQGTFVNRQFTAPITNLPETINNVGCK